jgi:hypothetical protein
MFLYNLKLIAFAPFSLEPVVQACFSAVAILRFFPFLFFYALADQVLHR